MFHLSPSNSIAVQTMDSLLHTGLFVRDTRLLSKVQKKKNTERLVTKLTAYHVWL